MIYNITIIFQLDLKLDFEFPTLEMDELLQLFAGPGGDFADIFREVNTEEPQTSSQSQPVDNEARLLTLFEETVETMAPSNSSDLLEQNTIHQFLPPNQEPVNLPQVNQVKNQLRTFIL